MANQTVLISGAGIAGPTLAYWLLRSGFKPTLVEEAPHLREGGYAIDFWGLGYDIADRMGLLPDLKRVGYYVQELRFVDDRGKRVGGFDVEVFRKLTRGRYVTLQRSDLARLIYSQIEGGCETIFGDSIAGIDETPDGVDVRFEHAPPRRFDLVVGADGLHSRVRSLVFGPQDQFETYLGYMVAAFEADGYRPRDEDVFISYSLPGKQIGRFTMRGDRMLFLFVFATQPGGWPDARGIDAQKAILHEEFGKGGWECSKILNALDRCGELYFDRVSQIQIDTWSRGRVALVGDAAFCPSLLAGQGTALAMTSAYVLAGELAAADGDPKLAFSRYEAQLRPFMTAKQKVAAQFASSFAPKTRFGIFLRNQITKAFSFMPIARLFIGRGLLDRLELPDYPFPQLGRQDQTAPRKVSAQR